MQRIVTFKIDENLLRVLDMCARRYRMTRSELIREAIEYYLRSKGMEIPPRRQTSTASQDAHVFEVVI